MSSLFSSLQTASTALDVYSRALGNEQTNISNVSTPGYAALRTTIRPIGAFGPPVGALDYIDVTTSGDAHTDALFREAASQAGASQTETDQLTPVNQAFDITGATGILGAFQKFSTAFANLSINPNSPSLQATAISSAADVAAAFRKTAAQVDSQKVAADSSIAGTVGQINTLAGQIRQYNVQIRGGATPTSGASSSLRAALDDLASLVDTTVSTNTDGTVSVLAAGQQPLVLGDRAFSLSYDASGAPGQQIVSSGGGGGPAAYSGKLGASLDFRNNTIGGLIGTATTAGTLNRLAQGFGARVNALLGSGTTASGSPGLPLFAWDNTTPANAARTLTIDPAFTPAQLAVATSAASNGTADALAKLPGSQASADAIDGFSAQDFYSGLASGVGQQLSAARDRSTSDRTSLVAAKSFRDKQSGVSLDAEAVAITAYQRAYQANAKVISILSELTLDVVNLVK